MDSSNEQENHPQFDASEITYREIPLQEGYELAFFTLRRLDDGQLQYFMVPPNSSDEHVQAIRIPRDNGPSNNHAISDGHEKTPQRDGSDREPSVSTVRRRAHARSDGYSIVCGVYSPELSAPARLENPGQGDFCCPRCGSNYTRPYSVKDHFYHCIKKYGNPQALRFTDHPSMWQTEAAIQRRNQASQGPSPRTRRNDAQMDVVSQESRFQEMSEALAHTSLRVTQERETSHDTAYIKTEDVFDPDIPRPSIETQTTEHYMPSMTSQNEHQRFRFLSSISVGQTPEWQRPPIRPYPPTFYTNPWSIGVPGSENEHAMMDMRATAPYDGLWPHVSQSPAPTNHDGIQRDGLDDYMDRRSCGSATPIPAQVSGRTSVIYEEDEMES